MKLSDDLIPGVDSPVILDFPADSQVVDELGNPIDDVSIADAVNTVIPVGDLPPTISYPGDPGDTWSIASVVKIAQDAVAQFRAANMQADRAAGGQSPLVSRSSRSPIRMRSMINFTPILWIAGALLAVKLVRRK